MKNVMLTTSAAALLCATGPAVAAATGAQADGTAVIEEALSAAPPQVAETARVLDLEGNVLREGTGAFTCFPAPPDVAGPMCMDEQWLAWMHAWMHQEPFTPSAVGFAYTRIDD